MDSILALPEAGLRQGSELADAFVARGAATFRQACQLVKDLPYGANARTDDPLVLFEEGRGTCLTKHGAIARLAAELELDVHKAIGSYRLTDEIITGVAAVLRPFGLTFVPSVHCFLECGQVRVDLTEANRTGKNKDLDEFDFVVRVSPVTTRDDIKRLSAAWFPRYCAMEPQLAVLGETAVRELLLECHRQAMCQCVSTPSPVAPLQVTSRLAAREVSP